MLISMFEGLLLRFECVPAPSFVPELTDGVELGCDGPVPYHSVNTGRSSYTFLNIDATSWSEILVQSNTHSCRSCQITFFVTIATQGVVPITSTGECSIQKSYSELNLDRKLEYVMFGSLLSWIVDSSEVFQIWAGFDYEYPRA